MVVKTLYMYICISIVEINWFKISLKKIPIKYTFQNNKYCVLSEFP